MNFTKGLPRPASQDELVALDFEMFKMSRPHRADGSFACLSIAYSSGDAYQIYDTSDIQKAIKRVDSGIWCMHNSLFDLRVLRRFSNFKQRYIYDTMLVEQDLFGGWYSTFSLADLSRRWLGELLPKDIRDEFSGRESMTPEMEEYAAQDALATVRIAQKQIDYINEEEDGQFGWYYEIDAPAIWAVLDMPPIRVDVDGWLANVTTLSAQAVEVEKALGFNAYSHVTVKKEVEKALGRRIKNTNANETLLPLLNSLDPRDKAYQLISAILGVREARKALETYGKSWIDQYVEDGEWVYPSWRVTGAETGRMSCADPNLQQVPVRKMPIFRKFFLASKGGRMLVADANQQEIRLAAALSGDDVLLSELRDGVDMHQITADLFGVDRDKGKSINLALNYGMSAYGLSGRMGLTEEQAEDGIKARRAKYKIQAAWQDSCVRKAQKNLKVRTLSGRPVWINPYLQHDGWKRNAMNGPVQGSAADHTKLALVNMHKICSDEGMPFRTNLVVHDEVGTDVPSGMLTKYKQAMKDAWHDAGHTLAAGVELPIEMASGRDWGCKT